MADLQVVALISAKPGSEQVVRDALTTLTLATREEDGCLAYSLTESQATPGTFVTVELWTSQADLDSHMSSPHIAEALTILPDHLAAAPAIHPLTPIL